MTAITETKIETQATVQWSWSILRIFIGLVILTAAFMKSWQLATTPSLGEGLLHARWFNVFVVEFEILFGVWLLAGLMPKLTWLASVGCFLIFASVSAYKGISGESSCGCFGAVTVPPVWTLTLDMILIGLLIVFRPRGIVFQWKLLLDELLELKRFKRVGVIAVVWLLLAVPATYAMMSVEKNDLVELGTEFIGADGKKTILLEPDKWIGKKLPLLPYIEPAEIREKLNTGKYCVLLVRQNCEDCKKFIREHKIRLPLIITLIESKTPSADDETNQGISLKGEPNWIVPTPCFIEVDNNLCITVET